MSSMLGRLVAVCGLCAVLVACAVTSASSIAVKGSVVSEPLNYHCIGPGEGTVLSSSEMNHNPLVPFAYGGWALTLEFPVPPVAGTTYSVPSDQLVATLWSISHHPSRPRRDIEGSVFIVSASARSIEAKLSLQSRTGSWHTSGARKYAFTSSGPASCMAPN